MREDGEGFFFYFSNSEYDANTYCIYKRDGEVILRVDHNHAKEAIRSFTVFGKEYRCKMRGVAFIPLTEGREIMNMIWHFKGNARKVVFPNYLIGDKVAIAAQAYYEASEKLGVKVESFLLHDEPLLLCKGRSNSSKGIVALNLCHLPNAQIKTAIYHELRHQWQCVHFAAEYENIKAYERRMSVAEKEAWYASSANPLEEDARVFGFSFGEQNAEHLFLNWR